MACWRAKSLRAWLIRFQQPFDGPVDLLLPEIIRSKFPRFAGLFYPLLLRQSFGLIEFHLRILERISSASFASLKNGLPGHNSSRWA